MDEPTVEPTPTTAEPDDPTGGWIEPPAPGGSSGAASPGSPTGWVPPSGSDAPSRPRRLLIGCLFVGVLLAIAGPLIATAILDQSGSSGPSIQAVGFGTGGSGCTLTNVASSFPLGVSIRDVVTFSPALPVGGTVTIKVYMNGAELVDLRETMKIEEPAPCIYGTMSPLVVGHYRVQYEVNPSMTPPISGEFDVTP